MGVWGMLEEMSGVFTGDLGAVRRHLEKGMGGWGVFGGVWEGVQGVLGIFPRVWGHLGGPEMYLGRG